MQQRDERVRLATAVSDLDSDDRLAIGTPRQPQQHISHQRLEILRRVGSLEKRFGEAIDIRRVAGSHTVEVCGEICKRQRALPHVIS